MKDTNNIMKILATTTLFILLSFTKIFGTNYYVSATGSDAANGTSTGTAWQTITKVNSFSSSTGFVAGDSILFKRGDSFYGALTIVNNGSSGNNIIVGAYGSGDKPIITGLSDVSGWGSIGTNLWESSAVSTGQTTAMVVTINGVSTPMGKWPNGSGRTNLCAWRVFSSGTTTTITDGGSRSGCTATTIPATFVGGTIVIRKNQYVIQKGTISAQSGTATGSTFTYSAFSGQTFSPLTANNGYFIQDHISTLDVQDEWYWNGSTHKLSMYSVGSPTGVKVSTITSTVILTNRSYITLTNLNIVGSISDLVTNNGSTGIKILNCTLNAAGNCAVWGNSMSSCTIQSDSILNSNNFGIFTANTANTGNVFSSNVILNTGVYPGLTSQDSHTIIESADGILALGALTAQNNIIKNTGYSAIQFRGSNVNIKNNFIDSSLITKDEGAAIYSYIGNGNPTFTNQVIDGNIIINSVGAPAGKSSTTLDAKAIYMDINLRNVTIINNTCANSGTYGIILQDNVNDIIRNNTVYNSRNAAFGMWSDGLNGGTINSGHIVNSNIFVMKDNRSAPASNFGTFYLENSQSSSQTSWGTSDSNVVSCPVNDVNAFYTSVQGIFAHRTLTQWQSVTGYDLHSTRSPKTIPDTTSSNIRLYYNETSSPKTFSFSGQNWIDMKNVSYPGSITLQPYTSKILLFSNNISGTPLSVSLQADVNPLVCPGNTTTIRATGTGGTTPYLFKIGSGSYQSSNVFLNMAAGTYTVTIQDASSPSLVATASITITQPNPIVVTEKHGSILVNGNSTSDTVTATGGSGVYTYKLDNGAYQTSNIFTNVLAGNHTDSVKDGNGCTSRLQFTITQPSILALSLSSTSIACNGGTSTITATASGGTTPYRYKLGTGSYQTSNLFTGNRAGTYMVTCSDSAGAVVSTNITITEPSAISITSLTFGTAPATVSITASGGVGSLSYSLDNGIYQATGSFTNVPAGTHTVTVRDANFCTTSRQFTILPSQLRVSLTVGTITCNGSTTSVTANPTGGTIPYTYLWSNGQTTKTATGLAGSITITCHVADAGSPSQTFDTSFVISQPSPIVVSASFGSAPTTVTVSQTGAVGTPNYSIDGGAYQVGNTFSGVAAGQHTVTVRDANLCTGSKQFTVLSGGTALALTLTAGAITCNGGSTYIIASATGGTPPYMFKKQTQNTTFYQASDTITNVLAGTTTINVRDATGAVVSASITITQPALMVISLLYGTAPTNVTVSATNGVGTKNYKLDNGSYQLSGSFSNVAAGVHTAYVRDANLCVVSKQFTVLTDGLAVSLSVGTISCNGGTTSATATVTGGATPYYYLWSNNQTTATATGLIAGTTTFHVQDNASHVFDTTFIITQPSAITISTISFSAILVNGGTTTVNVTASGGAGGLTYSLDGGVYQGSNSFAGVLAGNHTMDVKDANGCIKRKLFSITQPGVLIIHVEQITTIDCYGDSATVGVTATGGTTPYVGVDTFTVAAGTRTYSVTDAFGARADSIVTVTQPNAVIATVTTGTITFKGGSTWVKIVGTGGTGSYTYQLDNGGYGATDSITGVLAGTHTAYVKDANGCIGSTTFTLKQPNGRKHTFVPAAIINDPYLYVWAYKEIIKPPKTSNHHE